MASFVVKTLIVTALVCLAFDRSHGAPTEDKPVQGSSDNISGFDAAKEKVTDLVKTFTKSTAETLNKVQDAVKNDTNAKKIETQVTDFFSGAFNKLKNTFSSTKHTNPDDQVKQEAVKAFDDYATKQQAK